MLIIFRIFQADENISQKISEIIDFLESPSYVASSFHHDSPDMSPDSVVAHLTHDQRVQYANPIDTDSHNDGLTIVTPPLHTDNLVSDSSAIAPTTDQVQSGVIDYNFDDALIGGNPTAQRADDDIEFLNLIHTRLEQIRDERNETVSDDVIERLAADIQNLCAQGIYHPFDDLLK